MYRLFFLAFAATLASCSSPQNEEQPGPAEGQKFPSDIMYMQRSYPSGRVNTKAYASALQWKNRQRSTQGVWDFVGPTNIGGRVSDIEIAPSVATGMVVEYMAVHNFANISMTSSDTRVYTDA